MGSSLGFGSNPNNIAGTLEACPQVSRLEPALPWEGVARAIRLKVRRRLLSALFGLAFASAPGLVSLNLAAKINSSAHSSIGTQSSA